MQKEKATRSSRTKGEQMHTAQGIFCPCTCFRRRKFTVFSSRLSFSNQRVAVMYLTRSGLDGGEEGFFGLGYLFLAASEREGAGARVAKFVFPPEPLRHFIH